jgi:hypothetical protein
MACLNNRHERPDYTNCIKDIVHTFGKPKDRYDTHWVGQNITNKNL